MDIFKGPLIFKILTFDLSPPLNGFSRGNWPLWWVCLAGFYTRVCEWHSRVKHVFYRLLSAAGEMR